MEGGVVLSLPCAGAADLALDFPFDDPDTPPLLLPLPLLEEDAPPSARDDDADDEDSLPPVPPVLPLRRDRPPPAAAGSGAAASACCRTGMLMKCFGAAAAPCQPAPVPMQPTARPSR